MVKDRNFVDCVDFNLPKQANNWTNRMDTLLGKKARDMSKWDGGTQEKSWWTKAANG